MVLQRTKMTIGHIETQRLRIRSFQPNDWQGVYDYTSDPAVMMYILKDRLPPNKPRRLLPKIWANRPAPLLSSSRQAICSSGTWSFIRGLPLGLMRLAGSSIAPITAMGMPRKPLWHCSNIALRRCTCIGSSLPLNPRTLLRGGLWKSWACDERPTFESASGVRIMSGWTNTSMPFWKRSGSRPIRHNKVSGCEHVVRDGIRVD